VAELYAERNRLLPRVLDSNVYLLVTGELRFW
jgi:hypothetical protein